MRFDEYRRLDALNWSALKHMATSPLEFRHRQDHPIGDTDAMLMGRAVHTAVLEPDQFPLQYVVYPGPVRRGKEWDSFAAANADKDIIKASEYQSCLAMRDAVRSHPIAGALLQGGEAERTITWEMDNVPCKGRLDYSRPGWLIDLKSSHEVGRWFGSTAARLGYHAQLAWYWRGLMIANEPVRYTKIIAVQSCPPWDVVVYDVPGTVLDAGEKKWRPLFDQYRECLERGSWPGAGADEVELVLPAWAMMDDDEEEVELVIGGEKHAL